MITLHIVFLAKYCFQGMRTTSEALPTERYFAAIFQQTQSVRISTLSSIKKRYRLKGLLSVFLPVHFPSNFRERLLRAEALVGTAAETARRGIFSLKDQFARETASDGRALEIKRMESAMFKVLKKDNTLEDFKPQKIVEAIMKAAFRCDKQIPDETMFAMANSISERLQSRKKVPVAELHELVIGTP